MEFDLLYMDSSVGGHAACAADIQRDLKLDLLLEGMSGGDKDVYAACASVLTSPLTAARPILMRNEVVRDAALHGETFEAILAITAQTLMRAQAYAEYVKPKYDKVIANASKIVNETEIAQIFLRGLAGLKALLRLRRREFLSGGMRMLCDAAENTLTDEYLSCVRRRLEELSALRLGCGIALSGHLSQGLKQGDIVLNRLVKTEKKQRAMFAARSVAIPLSGITLIQNAQEITEKSLAPVYRVIAQFNRSVQRFFTRLDCQIKFFVGCFRLHQKLVSMGVPVCWPEFAQNGCQHETRMLMDAGLACKEGGVPVGNDASFAGKRLVLVTGPNQGGKTTFLRSVGLAQLMAQCGMFVTAQQYICPVFTGIYTHFPNGEDAGMRMGLLEVELHRLSGLVDALNPGALLLMNESFQTTAPGDARRLAADIIPALLESGVLVFFVTHLYAYAMDVYAQGRDDVLFLKAQRSREGCNTFCMREGEPFASAWGQALFDQVMKEAD